MSQFLDHVAVRVSDLAASRRFYEAALAPLGIAPMYETAAGDAVGPGVAFGRDGVDGFSIHTPIDDPGRDRVVTGIHVAFTAENADAVQAFHAAALASGARDLGAPGPRPEYSAGYYGAFVLDPDGNNIEAVWHADEPLSAD